MSNGTEFAVDVSKWAKGIAVESMEQVVIGVRLDLSTRIILSTPVGKPELWKYPAPPDYVPGAARANWQASLNTPITTNVQIKDKTGKVTLQRMRMTAMEPESNIYYLSNNLPYIRRLEYGWSTQAPQGMVRVSIIETQNNMNNIIAKAKK